MEESKSKQRKVLILTPTLGERETLAKTVDSVRHIRALLPGRVDHRIVTGKSKVDKLAAMYPDVQVVEEPVGGNIYTAINSGLMVNSEEYYYLGYINDDDYLLPDFTNLIDALDEDCELDFVYSKTDRINLEGEYVETIPWFPLIRAFIPLLAHGIPLFTQQSTLIKRGMFLELNGFDASYKLAADTEFWCRLLMSGCTSEFVNKRTAAYRFHDSNLSFQIPGLQARETMRLRESLGVKKTTMSLLYLSIFRLFNCNVYLNRIFKPKNR